MLIFKNHGWQIMSDFPDANYLEGTNEMQPKWVVHDNSDIAAKVMSYSHWEPVEDEDGNLIDIIPVEAPMSDEEKIAQFKSELDEIDRQAIRPLRAIVVGTDTEEDREILADLEQQAEVIRTQIAELENSKKEVN